MSTGTSYLARVALIAVGLSAGAMGYAHSSQNEGVRQVDLGTQFQDDSTIWRLGNQPDLETSQPSHAEEEIIVAQDYGPNDDLDDWIDTRPPRERHRDRDRRQYDDDDDDDYEEYRRYNRRPTVNFDLDLTTPRYVQPRYHGQHRRAVRVSRAHVAWCYDRYRSYRASDNSFQPNYGRRRQCNSPY